MDDSRREELRQLGVEPIGAALVSEHARPCSTSFLGIRVDFVLSDDEEDWGRWKDKYWEKLKGLFTSLTTVGVYIIDRIEVQDDLILLHVPSGVTNIYRLGEP